MDTETEAARVQAIINNYPPQLNLVLERALAEEYSVGRLQLVHAYPVYFPSDGSLHEGSTVILKMPFAGIFINWGLTFCLTRLEHPPTVTIMENIDIDKSILQENLKLWDITDKNCLTKLMKDLRTLYNDHEVNKFKQNKVLAACFNELRQKLPKIIGCVEFAYKAAPSSSFNVLVPLSLKTDDLPLISDTSPGMKLDSWTLCSVRIDGSLQSCALIIPEYLEALLETQLERVTKISSNQSTASLSNFVDYITSNIQQTLEAACEEYVDRRHFIAALLDLYPRNLADYDSKMYRHGTLYFKIGDICYVTHLAQVKHELQIAFFAVNRLVKGDHREEFPFCEKLTIQLAEKPNSPAFRQYLHETFVIHLDDFMLKVLGVFTKL